MEEILKVLDFFSCSCLCRGEVCVCVCRDVDGEEGVVEGCIDGLAHLEEMLERGHVDVGLGLHVPCLLVGLLLGLGVSILGFLGLLGLDLETRQ